MHRCWGLTQEKLHEVTHTSHQDTHLNETIFGIHYMLEDVVTLHFGLLEKMPVKKNANISERMSNHGTVTMTKLPSCKHEVCFYVFLDP